MKNKILISLFALTLAGCAVKNDNTQLKGVGLTYNSDIVQNNDGNYVASVEASLVSGRQSGAESYAIKNATDYCAKQNKTAKIIKKELDSHLLVNGVAKITFQCI